MVKLIPNKNHQKKKKKNIKSFIFRKMIKFNLGKSLIKAKNRILALEKQYMIKMQKDL